MSVTLASWYLSNSRPIPDLYSEISDFYAKVPALYAEIMYFCFIIALFGFHCEGNVCGRVPLGCLWSVTNDDV